GLSVNDMKRIIAYSTISTIGFMMLALGSGILGFTAGIFLLMNHAFFKALVFLAAGSVLHATGLLDIHKMGGLHKKMKITSIAMFIGVFSAAGLPPFSGFFGKDEVLLATLNATATNPVYSVLFVMSLVTAFLTVVFLFRMWFLIFTGTPRSNFEAHESPRVMTVPLLILSALAIGSGFSLFIGPGFGSFVFFEHAEVLQFSPLVTISSVSAGLAGLLVAYLLYYKQSYPSNRFYSGRFGNGLLRILMNKYWMDHIFYGFAEKVSYRFTLVIDWFDLYGIDGIVNGIGSGLATAGTKLRRIQTGFVSVYATIIAIGMIVLMIWLVLVGV
ncbi:MAG: NADH-quinone oxidoreductase subunit L, partial [Candidatus Bathyarchaeia archaeon]